MKSKVVDPTQSAKPQSASEPDATSKKSQAKKGIAALPFEEQTEALEPAPPARPATWTVKPGDTLSKIAKAVLGDPRRYLEIFELNRDQLTDPNLIYKDMVLKLPASGGAPTPTAPTPTAPTPTAPTPTTPTPTAPTPTTPTPTTPTPTASGKLALGGDAGNVHMPDLTQHKSNVVGLQGDAEYQDGQAQRTSGKTTVRVIFDKTETLTAAVIERGQVTELSFPEDVTLVKGDTVEIYSWHDNKLGGDVRLGFRSTPQAGKLKLRSLAKPTRPAGGGGGTFTAKPQEGPGEYWAGTLGPDIGGFLWKFEVTEAEAEGSTVRLQELGLRGQADPDRGTKEFDADQAGSQVHMHQQGQYYGDFLTGEHEFTGVGQTAAVVAPGSWGYHGADMPLGPDGKPKVEAKQAAYWVPIKVQVTNRSAQTGKLSINPSRLIKAEFGKAQLKPGEMTFVTVTFHGGIDTETKLCFD